MHYFLPFILISIASLMSTPVRSDEEFRSMEFPAAFFFVNKRLTKYAIKAIKVLDKDLCELHCYQENNCVSFNFKKNAEKGEATHICELNNSTHLDHEREFKDDTVYLYKGAKNVCGKGKRCENNGICQSGFTNKGYRCVCPEGFEGVHCEQNVDECSINSHSCDVNAVCRANIGSYVCECIAGYSGDGASCTDIDECTSGVHDCHSSASCTNTQGSFSCSCNHPYAGSGKNCHLAPGSCDALLRTDSTAVDGIHTISTPSWAFQVHCDMTSTGQGWTLVARFSNIDAKNWMEDSGEWWYDKNVAVGGTTDPSSNSDMISPAFWLVSGHEFKITRSDDSQHTPLLQTRYNCLGGRTFRSKITSYGNFRNGVIWASDRCRGSCYVAYSGQYKTTQGFQRATCTGNIQRSNRIGFWCDWSTGDGAVMMIGGEGENCARADHGIGITEANAASFVDAGTTEEDFGDNIGSITNLYSLNLWIK